MIFEVITEKKWKKPSPLRHVCNENYIRSEMEDRFIEKVQKDELRVLSHISRFTGAENLIRDLNFFLDLSHFRMAEKKSFSMG